MSFNNSTTSFIVINSKYRTNDSRSTTDFTYNIGQAIEVPSVTIKSVSIPVTQYNIGSYNNKLRISSGGIDYDFVIPEGQYDVTQLSLVIQGLIQGALGGAVTLSIDPITKKLVLTSTFGLKISVDPVLSSISKYLGLNYQASSYYPAVDSTTINFVNVPELQGSNNYYLASSVLAQGYSSILTDGKLVPIIMPIPIDVEWGQVQNYESQDTQLNTKNYVRLQNIQNIDIKIYDDDLNVVDLNGSDIEVVLKVNTGENLQPNYLNR